MNKPTEKAYLFFAGDPQARLAVQDMLESGKPASIIAEWLEEYMRQLNAFELLKVYHEFLVPAIEATHWEDVANILVNDALDIDPCGSATCTPEWECEDLQ